MRSLIELGSGSADKARVLLDAMAGAGSLRRYVPLDVSETLSRVATPNAVARLARVAALQTGADKRSCFAMPGQ